MNTENIKVTAKDKDGNILESKTTGKIYDADIKSYYIKEEFKKRYPNCIIESDTIG